MSRPTYVNCACNAGGECDCLANAQAAWDRRSRAAKRGRITRDLPVLPPGIYKGKIIVVSGGGATVEIKIKKKIYHVHVKTFLRQV